MAGRKLVRDMVISIKQPIFRKLLTYPQVSTMILRLHSGSGYSSNRQFSVFNEFSNKVKGEVESNVKFQESVNELKKKAGELKGVKEEFQLRTKQKTKQLYKHVDEAWSEAEATAKKKKEQLYKHVDGLWSDAEATAKKVSANVKEKISSATEEVKDSLGIGKQKSSGFQSAHRNSGNFGSEAKVKRKVGSEEENRQQSVLETIFSKMRFSMSPKVSAAFQKFKKTKAIDLAKMGVEIIKDELKGSSSKNNRLKRATPSSSKVERSSVSDVVTVPKSKWTKKWETLKDKLHGNPVYRRIYGVSEPVVTKSHEVLEDMRERWETSDSPVVHKIQDINDSVFGETHSALSVKEIKRRDPSFSLSEFVANVQEAVKPVLNAYISGDFEIMKQYCTDGVINRCKAERSAFQKHGIIFDNKILHISDVELRETKLMGNTPTIILSFQTQQVHCVRDKNGIIKEGGEDTIHNIYYLWAMQPEEDSEVVFPVWKLMEIHQLGVQALI